MQEDLINYIWILIQLIIGYNLVLPVGVLLAYYLIPPKKRKVSVEEKGDYAIIVTAYQHTELLGATVTSLLKLHYSDYLIYVVADNCDSELTFKDARVIVLKPAQILASNTGSHQYALKNFRREHNRIAIIDSDNVVHPEFLNKLDEWFKQGFEAVQGYRAAKNLDTRYACLDAARDIYYHFYDGKLLFRLGSSATLAGSGMAFRTRIYKSFLDNYQVKGPGFDKVLQYSLVKEDLRIAFAPEAIVYDEKTTASDQLINQRSRWINSWFRYFAYGFNLISSGLRSLSWNQFMFGIVLLRPPLFMFLGMSVVFLVINAIMGSPITFIWAAGLVLFVIGFAAALADTKVDRRIYKALTGIPLFVFYQILSLTRIGKLNKQPLTTRHGGISGSEHIPH
jgi:cellulose synthase/poly-beta-1,6-N-acetylglucosamine synthase-like glycosyltransferase